MKKLLVLMLVLGMASLANAVLLTTANVDWDIVGTQLIGTGTAVASTDLSMSLIDGANHYASPQATVTLDPTTDSPNSDGVMAIAGNNAKITNYYGTWKILAEDVIEVQQEVGVWFRFDIAQEGTVELWNSDMTTSLGTIYVPEPISMVLLGIGGLFLRRRK